MKPVLFDFESQSAVDLPARGGRIYAAHESTRVLCLCCLIDGHFHLWVPGQDIGLSCYADLWPHQFGERRPLHLWGGNGLPSPVVEAVEQGRAFTAHNCHEFDALVWRAKLTPVPVDFGDTLHDCRSQGLPGRLDDLAKKYYGHGKDAGNLVMRRLMTLERENGQWVNHHTTPGNVALVARYCVADVIVLERIWQEVGGKAESSVVRVHRTINERGIQLDQELARTLVDYGNRAAAEAGAEIERITDGELRAVDLKKPHVVKTWLRSRGLDLHSIRKQDVDRLLTDPDAFVREALEDDDNTEG